MSQPLRASSSSASAQKAHSNSDDADLDDLLSEATEHSSEHCAKRKPRSRAFMQGKVHASAKGSLRKNSKKQKCRARSPSPMSCASECTVLTMSSQEPAAEEVQKKLQKQYPRTSGLFDFADYLVQHVLTEAERNALVKCSYTFAELGAGYATATMCAAALQKSFAKVGAEVVGSCQFYTEQQDWKREVIKNTHSKVNPDHPCHVFINTGDVSKTILITDADVVMHKLPEHALAFFAIECDDVSLCSTTGGVWFGGSF